MSRDYVAMTSASWLLITREGKEEAGCSGWPADIDPKLLGLDTRFLWKFVPADFVKREYAVWSPPDWCGHPQGTPRR